MRLHRSRRPAKPQRSPFRRIVRALVQLTVAFYAFVIITLFAFRWINPPFTAVQIENFVLGLVEGRDEPYRRIDVPLSSVPVVLQRAVIAAEDGGFYKHKGIDWAELHLALNKAAKGGRLRGASTITQQLVKNLYLTNSRFPLRKAVEYTLVPLAESILGKDRILEIYLNVIEWGPNVWGVEAAAQYHYRTSAAKLNREQSARLAACIPSPRSRRPAAMDAYSATILERMRSRGW